MRTCRRFPRLAPTGRRTLTPLRVAAFTIIAILAPAGFNSAMANPSDPADTKDASAPMFPLRFAIHDFQVFCYNTLRCQVIYANHNFSPWKAEEEPSPPPRSPDYRDHWPLASNIGIRNFPPPVRVRWTSMDGVTHEAEVAIGTIFKDERVLYRVPDSEIPDRSWSGEPGILLEVNDRTINVYMKAFIATKTEQIPGNKYSNAREDVILAWTHMY